jgi:hypothetical protein
MYKNTPTQRRRGRTHFAEVASNFYFSRRNVHQEANQVWHEQSKRSGFPLDYTSWISWTKRSHERVQFVGHAWKHARVDSFASGNQQLRITQPAWERNQEIIDLHKTSCEFSLCLIGSTDREILWLT